VNRKQSVSGLATQRKKQYTHRPMIIAHKTVLILWLVHSEWLQWNRC